jgi:hypothetical protein
MNTWQLKRQRETEAQAATLLKAYNESIEVMRQECMAKKESVMEAFITKELNTMILPTPEEIGRRAFMRTYPDGYEEFVWDGVPRIVFHPVGLKLVDGKQRIVQDYHMVPIDEDGKEIVDEFRAQHPVIPYEEQEARSVKEDEEPGNGNC